MKTLGVLLSTAGLVGAGAIALTPAAQATPTDTSCSGTEVVSAAYVRRFGGSPVVGSIQLRRDSCSRYWAQLLMYDAVPQNALATAYLARYDGGALQTTWSCDSRGGTGRILPNQTTCRTPKLQGGDGGFTFAASAHELQNGGGGYIRVSWGQTSRTR